MKGKAYAHKTGLREGDLYHTPKSLIWEAEDIIKDEFYNCEILEPCAGKGAISQELEAMGIRVFKNDLYVKRPGFSSYDYLKNDEMYNPDDYTVYQYAITNPPFSLWNEFVEKAKTHCKKFMFIGRMNYLSTQSRLESGVWDHLKMIYPFSRYVDYQTPFRKDGLFHVGCQATAWFLWDMNFIGAPGLEIIDVQKYAKLGNLKRRTE